MDDFDIRSALINKDLNICSSAISSKLTGQSLIDFIYELIYASAKVSYTGDPTLHPICIVNSIKNFIGDDKRNPSKTLLEFAIRYLFEFEFRSNDQDSLIEVQKRGLGQSIFMSDLEELCQTGDWEKAENVMAQTFIASDKSRATLDALVELALQNSFDCASFINHLLRGYQFQEKREDNWIFIKCIFEQIKKIQLESPHASVNISPNQIKRGIIKTGDIVLFAAMNRIWEGEYVRIRGYKRELSYWLGEIKFSGSEEVKLLDNHFLNDSNKLSFIELAEKIINKKETKSVIATDLLTLEAVRSISASIERHEIDYIGSRFNYLLN